ncbi:MAG: hypothetical protein M3071_17540 [Actinomycetota bacterium]|nr:hypothetical protein [Actinomycetota bacterium]
MATGGQARLHGVEIDPVARGIDQDVDPLQRARQYLRITRVNRPSASLPTAVLGGHGGGALGVEVEQEHARGLVRSGEIADDRGSDRPGGAKDGDGDGGKRHGRTR